MKSRAAIFEGVGKPLVIDEIEVDPPRQGEVLVRLQATGLCHTEIWYMSGGDTRTLVPAILGHEGGGVVQQVGPGVKSLQEGDHVIPLYIAECGECPQCRSDATNLCSAIYNLCYYHGFAEALGGRTVFEKMLQGTPIALPVNTCTVTFQE